MFEVTQVTEVTEEEEENMDDVAADGHAVAGRAG